jgi:hypothetical protein
VVLPEEARILLLHSEERSTIADDPHVCSVGAPDAVQGDNVPLFDLDHALPFQCWMMPLSPAGAATSSDIPELHPARSPRPPPENEGGGDDGLN